MSAIRIPENAIARLAEYWYRANLMHELLHKMREMYQDDIEQIRKEGHDWEFLAYLCFWLSALFVVVEGFNKLKLKNARVQRLFNAHLEHLKQMRHETYHFSVEKKPLSSEVIRALNWAEELHEAIGDHICEIVNRKAQVERITEKRLKAKRVG
jgi:hypothetical protein